MNPSALSKMLNELWHLNVIVIETGRRRFLALTCATGLATVAGCQRYVSELGAEDSDRTGSSDGADSPERRSYLGVLSKAGPSEFSDSDDGHSGWVHTVAHGETYDVTFDVRICHDSRDAIEVDLFERASDEYALSFDTGGGAHRESDCNFGTHVTGSGSIPTDFESLSVTVNDEPLQTMNRDGTLPRLQPLPDPIDAR